ncbi:MAG: polysaccharide deacetylase family protein [Bacteroidia bacterium]|nr:polysaccharide deacetylase family protein [Bacteroidia bacterium]NNM15489.1 polysaccharide deacetylase family protein [Bacteroidia bacterium]
MIRNFLFHRVNPQRDPLWDPMDVALFEKCIEHISNKYDVVLFEDLALDTDALKQNKDYATIMFDDGYKDNIEYALPILEKYNVKASFYIVTDCIDNNIPTWTNILEYLFQNTKGDEINLPFDFLPEALQIGKFSDTKDRLSFVSDLKPYLKTLVHSKREVVLQSVRKTFSDVELPEIMMSWGDVKKLKSHGHYVGSHTATHSMLGSMESEQDIERELIDSGNKIKSELGYFPLTISYPVGSYDQRVKQLSEKTGYKIGLAVKQDVYDPAKDDLFEVSRIELYNEPWFKTKMRISNSLEDLKKLIKYK